MLSAVRRVRGFLPLRRPLRRHARHRGSFPDLHDVHRASISMRVTDALRVNMNPLDDGVVDTLGLVSAMAVLLVPFASMPDPLCCLVGRLSSAFDRSAHEEKTPATRAFQPPAPAQSSPC